MLRHLIPSICILAALVTSAFSADPPPIVLTNFTVNGNVKSFEWNRIPVANSYKVVGKINLRFPFFQEDTTGVVDGNQFTSTNSLFSRFWQLEYSVLSSNEVLTANVLNRLAYGPTPDELERVNAIGPQAYIDEQLAPENLPPDLDNYSVVLTNSSAGAPSGNVWQSMSVTGRITSSTIYMYLTEPGEVHIDNVSVRVISVFNEGTTNEVTLVSPNTIVNGDFEQPLSTGWTVSPNHAQSAIDNAVFCSGAGSLHMVATSGGTTRSSSIYQDISPELPIGNARRCVLSFDYLPGPNSRDLTLRLSGSGTITSGQEPEGEPEWIYAEATGRATSNPLLYIYLDGAGEAFVDDIKLVSGADINSGPNLLLNPGFESPLSPSDWQVDADFTNSFADPTVAFSGNSSLHVVATGAGNTPGSPDSVYQEIPALVSGQTYTLGYWYRPPTRGRDLIVRLSGSQLVSEPNDTFSGIKRQLDKVTAEIEDLRSWYFRNAVGSQRQLLQVLLQFFENHFVTQHSKSSDFLNRYYQGDSDRRDEVATQWEYREISRWRDCLLQPDCTFFDLLTISAESPAMIVYMDNVDSRANGDFIANENFPRELLELFACGVDNGYDQNDIVAMSRAWAGWSVELVREEDIDNPHAERSRTYGAYPGSGFGGLSNLVGVLTFNYKPEFHGTNRAPIWSVWDPNSPGDNPVAIGPKMVPARFGAPWAGTPYQLQIPPRYGPDGINDARDVLEHIANLPFTMEYISVKLCRLFIHEDFQHGVYAYPLPNNPDEVKLVRDCMLAWENSTPKGNIRAVLQTIFDSDLFRTYNGTLQKVKTPLEFTASAIRALRSDNGDGTFTANTDGYDVVGDSRNDSAAPLNRMGAMLLFDRGDPDGYPEFGAPWISAGTLAERIRFVQSMCIEPGDSGHNGSQSGLGNDAGTQTYADPVALLKKKLPEAQWTNDRVIINYLLGIIYPGVGLGNLNQYHNAAFTYLNTDEDGVTQSPFAALSHTSDTYDERVRGMVAMLLSFQRFQEQ